MRWTLPGMHSANRSVPPEWKVRALEQKHMIGSGRRFEPDKRNARIGVFQCAPIVTDFAYQHSVSCQDVRRLLQDAVYQGQSISAPGERAARLVAVLGREPRHACIRDVGRVAYNQVVAVLTERVEQVRPDQMNAMR